MVSDYLTGLKYKSIAEAVAERDDERKKHHIVACAACPGEHEKLKRIPSMKPIKLTQNAKLRMKSDIISMHSKSDEMYLDTARRNLAKNKGKSSKDPKIEIKSLGNGVATFV